MLISLTVGKLDAGLAILLTEDKRLVCPSRPPLPSYLLTSRLAWYGQIEFPSILLPSGIVSGSIVDIQVSRNAQAEAVAKDAFAVLQDEIYGLYGVNSPKKPVLRLRNATQTSIVLEWDPIELATATLRSLTLYRNNTKAGAIPNPTAHTSTKISGLAVGEEYSFHLVLRTSAGTYSSDKVTARTHKMTDLSGITVCPGVLPAEAREELEAALLRIGANPLQDSVRIDTTHFICTEGRGQGWEKALDMNIPVVQPKWIEACEREGRVVAARNYYLGVDTSKIRQMSARTPVQSPSVQQTPASPRPPSIPPARPTQAETPAASDSESTAPAKTETSPPAPASVSGEPAPEPAPDGAEDGPSIEAPGSGSGGDDGANETEGEEPGWIKPEVEEDVDGKEGAEKGEEKFVSVQL